MNATLPALCLAAILAAVPPGGDRRARPDGAAPLGRVESIPTGIEIYNDYEFPARAFAGAGVVVHWVERGVDAPPLNDDDADGVPDYVERVSAAGDTALRAFARRGFVPVRPDHGGPDSRPDVYVSRFAAGVFGVAFPAVTAEGGSFVVVSNLLDPSDTESFGSLAGTVAHELFHLVQFSYVPEDAAPELPDWIREGSAAAIEALVYPRLDDLVWGLQLRRWLSAPERGVVHGGYGAAPLFRYLDGRAPRLLRALLRQRRPTARTLATTYAAVTHRPFGREFARFALAAFDDYAGQLAPYTRLALGGRTHATVAPLAVHYVRLPRAVDAVLRLGCARRCDAVVAYEREAAVAGRASRLVVVRPARRDGVLVFRLRQGARLTLPTLVLANGSAAARLPYGLELTRSRG